MKGGALTIFHLYNIIQHFCEVNKNEVLIVYKFAQFTICYTNFYPNT